MSSYVIYAGVNAVAVAGDTAITDESNGTIAALIPKVYLSLDRSFAIVARGPVSQLGTVITEMRAKGLDLDKTLEWVRAGLMPELRQGQFEGLSFAIAGISPTRGPLIASFETRFPDQNMPRPPYVVHEEPGEAVQVLSHLQADSLADLIDLDRLGSRFDTEAVKILQRVRDTPMVHAGRSLVCAAGQVQTVTITPRGTEMKTIGYWPDYLGAAPNTARKFVWAM